MSLAVFDFYLPQRTKHKVLTLEWDSKRIDYDDMKTYVFGDVRYTLGR